MVHIRLALTMAFLLPATEERSKCKPQDGMVKTLSCRSGSMAKPPPYPSPRTSRRFLPSPEPSAVLRNVATCLAATIRVIMA